MTSDEQEMSRPKVRFFFPCADDQSLRFRLVIKTTRLSKPLKVGRILADTGMVVNGVGG